MAVRPVRFISDLLTRKQILKTDSHNNVLFKVSSSNDNGEGSVSSSLPITSSGLFIDGDALIAGTLTAKKMHITEVTTSVYYEDSISASINALYDVSASNAVSGNMFVWNGNNWVATGSIQDIINAAYSETSSFALTSSYSELSNNSNNALNASYALTAAYALNAEDAVMALHDLTDVKVSGAIAEQYLKYDGSGWVASAVNGIGVSRQSYTNLRFNSTGTFGFTDTIEIELPTYFTTSSVNYINFNILTKETLYGNWRNDLASVEFKISGSSVYALLSAPSLPYAYSFNAINEDPQQINSSIIVGEYTDLNISGQLNIPGYNIGNQLNLIEQRFNSILQNYANLSETSIGFFDSDGTKNIQLINFSFLDLEYLYVDVMVKQSGSREYVNDLISVALSGNIDTNKVHVLLNAMSLGTLDTYKIIATKQTGSLF